MLAALLWRRGLVRLGEPPSLRDFHRISLVATPLALVAAVTALALATGPQTRGLFTKSAAPAT